MLNSDLYGLCRQCTQVQEVNGTLSEAFGGKVGVHQGSDSVLYCLL